MQILSASIAHELRTPLTAVVGLAFELKDRWDDFTAADKQVFIEVIAEQSTEVSDLVEDLLVAGRAELGTISLKVAVIDPAEQVRRVIAALNGEDPIDAVLPAVGPPMVGDEVRVRQIIRNLLTNARRYGGGLVRVEIGQAGGLVAVRVVDDGEGVPPEDWERIFDAYYRSTESPIVTASAGLGLSVSRDLARLMDGDLVYRREDDRSVFELTLPRAE